MSRATLTRLHKLEVKAKIGTSVRNMTDEQLFAAYQSLINRGGGADVFSASLEAEGEERLAEKVLAFAFCQTASEFMALPTG